MQENPAWHIAGNSINDSVNHFYPSCLSSSITFSERGLPWPPYLKWVLFSYSLSYKPIYFHHSTYQNLKLLYLPSCSMKFCRPFCCIPSKQNNTRHVIGAQLCIYWNNLFIFEERGMLLPFQFLMEHCA